ncbi:MAG: intermembrane phospholipid transport protein YdbH family protein, partial [Luminiphilus sp.]
MLKRGFVALVVALLVIAVSAAKLSRYSAIEIARWWLPSDWTLDQLSDLSLHWRGGSVERLVVTIPQGALLADKVQWQWHLRLSLEQPVTVVALSSRRAVWRPAQSPVATVLPSAEATQAGFRLDDFRQSSWWPAVASSSVAIEVLLLDVAEETLLVRMTQPVTFDHGALAAQRGDVSVDLEWARQSVNEWAGSFALTGPHSAHSRWHLSARENAFAVTGDLSVPDLSASTSSFELEVLPFTEGPAGSPLITAQAEVRLPLPEPLSDRQVTAEMMAVVSETGGGRATVTASRLESVLREERLSGRLEATWDGALSALDITLPHAEIVLSDIDLGESRISEFRTGVTGSLDPASGMVSLETSETQIVVTGSDWAADVRSSGLSVMAGAEQQSASGSLQIESRLDGRSFPGIDLIASASATGGAVQAELTGFAPWGSLGVLRAQYKEGESTRFEAQVDSTLWDWPSLQSTLSASIPELADIEIASLNLSLDASGEWRDEGVVATLSGQAREGYFSTAGLGVAGLKAAPFALRVAGSQIAPVAPIELSLDAVNTGVTLTDLAGTVGKDDQGWLLIHAEGSALGGELVIDQFRDFSSDGPLGTVYLNNIDLAAVVDIAGTEGVNIQGRATAALPLVWQNGMV